MIDEKLKERALNAPDKGAANPRKKIQKIGQKITDVVGHKLSGVSSDDAEYWGLAGIISEEQADILLPMKLRTPYTISELWELCKVKEEDKPHFQELLDDLSFKGVLEYDYGYHYDHNGRTAPQYERHYNLTMSFPGSSELFHIHTSGPRELPVSVAPGRISCNKRLEGSR